MGSSALGPPNPPSLPCPLLEAVHKDKVYMAQQHTFALFSQGHSLGMKIILNVALQQILKSNIELATGLSG